LGHCFVLLFSYVNAKLNKSYSISFANTGIRIVGDDCKNNLSSSIFTYH